MNVSPTVNLFVQQLLVLYLFKSFFFCFSSSFFLVLLPKCFLFCWFCFQFVSNPNGTASYKSLCNWLEGFFKKREKEKESNSISESNCFNDTSSISGSVKEEVIPDRHIFVWDGLNDLLCQNATQNRSSRTKLAKHEAKTTSSSVKVLEKKVKIWFTWRRHFLRLGRSASSHAEHGP